MQLSRFHENTMLANLGLHGIDMSGLGNVVALFGPNGAGKSRILRVAREVLRADLNFMYGANGATQISQLSRQTADLELAFSLYEKNRAEASGDDSIARLDLKLTEVKSQRASNDQALAKLQSQQAHIDADYTIPPSDHDQVFDLTLKKLELQDVDTYQRQQMHASINDIGDLTKPEHIERAITPFLHNLALAAFNKPNPNANQNELAKRLELFDAAVDLIRVLMGMTFGFVPSGADAAPALDGKLITVRRLSEGQRRLLFYVVCLLSQLQANPPQTIRQNLRGSVLILDEPEVHLHPGALVEVISRLKALVGERGQIWIASHADALLPFLDSGEIWIVDHGTVTKAGYEGTGRALRALIGSDDAADRFRSLLYEPDRWSVAKFLAECLVGPAQVAHKPNDPQLFQVSQLLGDRLRAGQDVRILDYGAGRGRLATMLQQVRTNGSSGIEYVPIEPLVARHAEIVKAAGPLLRTNRVYETIGALPTEFDHKMDVAVLCNVLHELRPTQWCHELNSIMNSLADDAALIIAEDQEMPIGERPNALGYLVLGVDELKTLFGLKQRPTTAIHPDSRYSDRLLCAEIRRDSAEVSHHTVARAIEDLRRRVKNDVKSLRSRVDSPTPREGRHYAFLSEMLTNCNLALEELATP